MDFSSIFKRLFPALAPREMETSKPEYSFKLFKFALIKPAKKGKSQTPWPRSGHRIVCNQNCLYVYGGYSPQYEDPVSGIVRKYLFNELWQFNLSNRTWTLLPGQETIPPELASVAVIFDGRTLMAYGGTSLPFGISCSNRLYYSTLTNDKVHEGFKLINASGDIPEGLYGQALVFLDGYVYTIGGTSGDDFTFDIHRLNLSTNVWESVYRDNGSRDYHPEPRYRHEVACDGNNIYIFGGGTKMSAFDLEYIPTFSIRDRVWNKKATIPDPQHGSPEPRMCHSCVQYTDPDTKEIFVYIIGGNSGPVMFFKSVWRLRLRDMSWTLITSLKHAIFFNSACITQMGKVYMFGGIQPEKGYKRTNTLHAAWVVIPKLSEMCWEAMLHYYEPGLLKLPKEVLLANGIPKHFVNRLNNYVSLQ